MIVVVKYCKQSGLQNVRNLKLQDMTQLTINVEDLPHLKKILNAIEGVSIAKPSKKKKCGLDEALDDVKAGRVHCADSVDDMFKQILGI